MAKIKLTEDQLNRVVITEGMYDQIKTIFNDATTNQSIISHPPASLDYDGLSSTLYSAIKGLGTKEEDIQTALSQIPDLPSLNKLIKTFKSVYGKDLLGWLDDDFDTEQSWNTYIYQPLLKAKRASEAAKHYEVKKSSEGEKLNLQLLQTFKETFPCIESTPGFTPTKTDLERKQLKFKSDYGTVALNLDGSAWIWDGSKWAKQTNKITCPADSDNVQTNEELINEQGLTGFNQQPSTTTDATSGTTTGTTDATSGTTTGTTSGTTTGDWITSFQTQLKSAGYGADLGTSGANGDGVDGKLGAKTATAAYRLLKAKNIISETTVFKNEDELKLAVEKHLSEDKEMCGCGCEIGKCECGPECKKCDCGKKKDAKEDWDPTGSVGVNGVAQDVARKGMNTLWEQELNKNFKRLIK